VTIYFQILDSPRAEDSVNGTYKATGDFRVGQGANLTVRVRANPKPYLADWKVNGTDLDMNRFQPWTTDQFLFQNVNYKLHRYRIKI
jgi:hypothetical protein